MRPAAQQDAKTTSEEVGAFESVLIYGMGMMGASLAHALKNEAGFTGKVAGIVRTRKSADFIRNYALADQIIVSETLEDARKLKTAEYDLIVLGLPVASIVKLMPLLPEFQGIVTDMSSTRSEVQAAAAQRPDLRFVGAHPMCGSENRGPSAYVEGLYKKRLCLLTPTYLQSQSETDLADPGDKARADALLVENFWKTLGMKTHFLDPASHDQILAYLSHGPHVISSMLTLWAEDNTAVANSTRQAPMPVTGGGFKDMARIAGSNPEMWTDIMETNRDNIIASLESFLDHTRATIERLEQGGRDDWLDWFARARKARNRLCGYPENK